MYIFNSGAYTENYEEFLEKINSHQHWMDRYGSSDHLEVGTLSSNFDEIFLFVFSFIRLFSNQNHDNKYLTAIIYIKSYVWDTIVQN